MTLVVYHLLGKPDWFTVAVNGSAPNTEWEFQWRFHRFVSTTFSPKTGSNAIQFKRPGTIKNSKWNAQFPLGNSIWDFWSAFQEIIFFSIKFPFGETKVVLPFTFQSKFPDFLGK